MQVIQKVKKFYSFFCMCFTADVTPLRNIETEKKGRKGPIKVTQYACELALKTASKQMKAVEPKKS